MFDEEGGSLPGQGLTGVEPPGDRYCVHPGPARGLEVANLVANIEDLLRIEGKGAGPGEGRGSPMRRLHRMPA